MLLIAWYVRIDRLPRSKLIERYKKIGMKNYTNALIYLPVLGSYYKLHYRSGPRMSDEE